MVKYGFLFILLLFCFGCNNDIEEENNTVDNTTEENNNDVVEENNTMNNDTTEEEPKEVNKEDDLCDRILEAGKSIEHLPYVWGGDSLSDGGMDCSGSIYHVHKVIGKPVPRTTSKKYNLLAGGNAKHGEEGKCGNGIGWTFTPDRPFGHIGQHIEHNVIGQSGSSTGPTEISIGPGSYGDGIFEETKDYKE